MVEAVKNGETGLLVEPGNSEQLADALLRLCEDPALRRRLGTAGRERMQKEFSIATMVQRHIQLYESVLAGEGAPAG
jgi:glycosyltransferase involved in cell wall biosynthesis